MRLPHHALSSGTLAALAVLAFARPSSGTTGRSASHGPNAVAAAIDVSLKDAPKAISWTSTRPAPESVTALAVGKKAVACMQVQRSSHGRIGPDPFGTLGKPQGVVSADVTSSTIAQAGASDGVPSFDSEVVVSTAAQSDADLGAFTTKAVIGCLASAVQSLYSIDIASTAAISWGFLKAPHYGAGSGGVHVQFVLTATGSSTPLIEDEFFYAEGRAEVALQFFSLGAPFNEGWADGVIRAVMARAKADAG